MVKCQHDTKPSIFVVFRGYFVQYTDTHSLRRCFLEYLIRVVACEGVLLYCRRILEGNRKRSGTRGEIGIWKPPGSSSHQIRTTPEKQELPKQYYTIYRHDFPLLSLSLSLSLSSDQRAPEDSGGTLFVLGGEELRAGFDELLLAELAIVVGVDGVERGRSQTRVEPDNLEEEGEFVALDETVAVRVDCAEEERQRSGQHVLQLLVVQLLSHRLNEHALRQLGSAADDSL